MKKNKRKRLVSELPSWITLLAKSVQLKDVLEDLREQRVIGIISHVEGMKTQIPMQLEVRPTEAGPSTVKMAMVTA
jgi:hypothetical protein